MTTDFMTDKLYRQHGLALYGPNGWFGADRAGSFRNIRTCLVDCKRFLEGVDAPPRKEGWDEELIKDNFALLSSMNTVKQIVGVELDKLIRVIDEHEDFRHRMALKHIKELLELHIAIEEESDG